MKKSKHIKLILITAALASCNRPGNNDWEGSTNHTYIRSDSTAPYNRTHHYYGGGGSRLWYYAFRPYGNYYDGSYRRAGYYSDAIHPSANIGNNGFKSGVVRGGFGHGSFSVGS